MTVNMDQFVRRMPLMDDSIAYPCEGANPVFRQPWEAKAFAMVVIMNAKGLFPWKVWVDHLSAVIAEAAEEDPDEDGSRYYYHWLAALERVLEDRGISTPIEITEREDEVVAHVNHHHHEQKQHDNTKPISVG